MASTALTRTSSASATKGTLSMWVKRSKLGSSQHLHYNATSNANNHALIVFTSANQIEMYITTNGAHTIKRVTNRKFADTNAWYHFVFVSDVNNSTAQHRMRIYVNGVEETSFSTNDSPSGAANRFYEASASNDHVIGANNTNGGPFDGLISHVYNIVDTVYAPSDFGETDATTGQWKIKTAPSVTFGSQGYLILKDGNTITDQSDNSNDFTLAAGTLTKSEDSPSNIFPTINPLSYQLGGCTLAHGNTSLTATGGDGWRTMYGTLAASSGKFYWEQKVTGASGSSHYIGISDIDESRSVNTNDFENGGVSAYCYRPDGGKVTSVSGSTVLTAGAGASFTTNDIIGIAMDLDNQKIYFSKNGTWQASGDPTSGATGTGSFFDITAGKLYNPTTATYNTNNNFSYNFGNGYFGTTAVASAGTNASGNGIFEYDVPTGYTALTTKGLNL